MFAPISCAIKPQQIYDSSLHPGSVSRPCMLFVIAPVPGGHSIDVITIDSMVSIHEVYSHSYNPHHPGPHYKSAPKLNGWCTQSCYSTVYSDAPA